MTLERFTIPAGEVVLVDELGAKALLAWPAEELAVIVEIGGRRNKLDARSLESYMLAPGQAGELVAAIVNAVANSGSNEIRAQFTDGLKRPAP